MPTIIDGTTFLSVSEVADLIGVSRQTLWRWKKAGHIPNGHRYRGRMLLFTRRELDDIRAYAHRLKPDTSSTNTSGDNESSNAPR